MGTEEMNQTLEAQTVIPHRDVTAVSFVRPNGRKTTIYVEVSGEPLPLGSFTADDVPDRIRRVLSTIADSESAVAFESIQTRIPTKGSAHGG